MRVWEGLGMFRRVWKGFDGCAVFFKRSKFILVAVPPEADRAWAAPTLS